MSDGDKKPGLRDIGDLKARLGMLNKGSAPPAPSAGPGANPFAPQPSAPPAAPAPALGLQGMPSAEVGADTAIVRIDKLAVPAPAPTPAPAPAPAANPFAQSLSQGPAPAPSAPPAGGALFGGNLFASPEPAQPAANPFAPVEAAPAAQPQFAQPQFAQPQFAPEPAAETPPPQGRQFVNPLQAARTPPPQDLSANDEADLKDFELKQAGVTRSFAYTIAGAAALITLFFGYFIGNSMKERKLLNAQIIASTQVRDRVTPLLLELNQVAPAIVAMGQNPNQVDWAKVRAIPEQLPGVDLGSLLATPVPLQSELATALSSRLSELNQLFMLLDEHRRFTLGRDRKELESLERGDSFGQYTHYAVHSAPRSPTDPALAKGLPPEGRIVALRGTAERMGEEQIPMIPVVARGDQEPKPVPVAEIVLIPKTDLLAESGAGNVLSLYSKRVEQLNNLLKKIEGGRAALEDQLKTQAARSQVFSL